MRRLLFRRGRVRRVGGRNHFTTPRLEDLETRSLLSGNAALVQAYGQLPMSFELNEGQTASQVAYLSQGSGYTLFLTPTESVLSLQAPAAQGAAPAPASPDSVLSMQLVGASATPQFVGQDLLPGVSNDFIGNDPSQWHADIPNYGQVDEQNVYPGVDLVYYGNQQQLEYDFTVAPGTDPGVIRMAFTGAQSATLDDQGNLVLQTAGGPVVEQAPVLYQESAGVRQAVTGHFVLEGNGQVGFAVGNYDPSQPLVIDPVLSYSTYLGGISTDTGAGIAVDSSGNAYVTGSTGSSNFPTQNPPQGTPGGGFDVFVAELNATGSALIYSTFLGGSGADMGLGIAVDSSGNAYVTGSTSSTNFPTKGPLQASLGGSSAQNAFVTKLNAGGSTLVYSTYLGGSGTDSCSRIAVDSSGNAYVIGNTNSTNFPTKSPLQASLRGTNNAVVAELNAAGSALVYSTYLGGSSTDEGRGIAVDSSGDAYVTGYTTSSNFPTKSPEQAALGGGAAFNAFVAKLNPGGSALVYSTYLGGSTFDEGLNIAVDSSGNAYVTGVAGSSNFPTKNPLQSSRRGSQNAFVTELNAAGSALVYSTYLGGSTSDEGLGIAVDSSGDAYVTGYTRSSNFPTQSPLQASLGGTQNAFVTELNAAGSAPVFSTYLGGSSSDLGQGIAVDSSGNVYVTGSTNSTNFPTKSPLQATFGGGADDAFVAMLGPSLTNITITIAPAPANPSVYGQSVTFTTTVAPNPVGSGTPTGTVQFQIDGTNFGSPVTLVNGSATSSADSSLSVGARTITAIYSGDSNFTGGNTSTTQTVNPAALTITANNATKTYGQTATFASTAFTTMGLVNGDTVGSVTETSTGSGATAAAGTDNIVPSNATFSAGTSSNYTITDSNGTLTVNPAALLITANNASKTYGQTATFASAAFTTMGLVNGDTVGSVTETSTGSGATAAAGTDNIVPSNATFSAGTSSNYTITYSNGTLTVNPAALLITANNASKTYGQTATFASAAFTTMGLVNGDTVGSITETSTGSGATAAAGTDNIVPSNATFSAGTSSNYTITYSNGTLTVNPAALLITANNASKTYGQTATFASTAFTTMGLVNGDTVGSVTETSTGSAATAAAGTDNIVPSNATFSAGASSNYTITYANGILIVNPAALLITANNASKTYGQTATFASTAFTTMGLVNGDTVGSVTETSTGSAATAAAGTDNIVPSNATFSAGASSNYTITYANGTLTVNPAALLITANNASKTYGQTATFASTAFTTMGLVNGDTVGSVTETSTGSAATAAAGTDNIVPSNATFSAGASSNYTITYANGTLTVNPAALLITANNASKTYGQTATFASTAFTTMGLVNGDTVSSVTETSTGSGATAAAGTDNIVPSNATFSAGTSSNYTITYSNGTLTVNPAALIITANNATKTYGQTATFDDTAFTTIGLVDGDTVGSVTETSTGSAATAAAGTDNIVPSNATFSAGTSSNYTITYANGMLTVNRAPATLTLGNLMQTYSGGPEPVTVTTSPAGLSGVSVTYNGSTTAPTNAGSYTVVASLTNASFTANNATGTLVIDPATPAFSNLTPPQTIGFGAPSITLGGTLAAGSLPATGMVTITLNGVSQTATLDSSGNFSSTFNTATLAVSGTAYPVAYSFTATTDFAAASNTTATSVTVNNATATLTLSNLAQTYTGGPEPVTVTTSPAGLGGVSVTYNGSTTAPTNAGSYTVVASLTNASFTANNATGTLVIDPATPAFSNLTPPQTIGFGAPSITLGGTLAAGSLPATGMVTITLNGVSQTATLDSSGNFSSTFNTATLAVSGTAYPVAYSFTATTDFAAASNTTATSVTVNNATATLTLSNLAQTYTGGPEPVTVTTSPAGLGGVSVTYNSSTTAPTNAGSYTVVASLTNASFTANNATGTLVIDPATPAFSNLTPPQTIGFGAPSITLGGTLAAGSLPATGMVTITLNGVSQTATLDSSGNFSSTFNTATLAVSGTAYPVAYSFTATTDFAAASNTTATSVTVNNATATLTLSNLAQTYTGGPEPVTVTTSPAGLGGVSVTYNGSTAAPTNAGSYAVVASLTNANFTASSVNGTLVIGPAMPVFSGLTAPQAIAAGTAMVTLGGNLAAGSLPATGSVAITLGGVQQLAPLDSSGNFAATFNTATLAPSATAYPVSYSDTATTNFAAASNTTATTVTVTVNAPPPPAATTQGAAGISTTAVTLSGSVNPEGGATSVSFVYGTDPSLNTGTATTPAQAVGGGMASVPVSTALTNLTLGTTYYYRVVATSAGGTTDGAKQSFATLIPPPPTPATGASSAPRIATAEKQTFVNLAAAVGQRAARLAAIAAATSAPLNTPLFELAADYFADSQAFAAIEDDPTDSNFTTVAPPQDLTVPPLTAGGGITQAEADQFNALSAEEGQALGLAEAISTALNRAQGAGISPANATDLQMQLTAVTQDSQQLGALIATEPGLLSNVQTALQQGGVADVSVSSSDVAALQAIASSSGLPGGLVQALQQLQVSTTEIQAIQAQFVQEDPGAASGSLAATLTDPAYAALVATSAQALMSTVLLTGSLSPSSFSGTTGTTGITNVSTPLFSGTAPRGTLVRLTADNGSTAAAVVALGQTSSDSTGHWQIMAGHLPDGSYTVSAEFSMTGSSSVQVTPLTQIVIDTVGPRVTSATYNKTSGLVTVIFSDPMGLDMSTLANPSFFSARGSKSGPALKVTNFQHTADEVTFIVSKGRTHPATIYLDVVSGGVRNAVGNALNGTFTGTFPSGNGTAGGDYLSVLPVPKPKKKPTKSGHKGKA